MNLSELGEKAFEFAKSLGHYQGDHDKCDLPGSFAGEPVLMVFGIASEVFEAYQEARRDNEGREREELADALIRIMSYAHARGWDMEKQIKSNMSSKKRDESKSY